MIVRIVKMIFKEDKVNNFLLHFEKIKLLIRNFDGCEYLELFQDQNQNNILFSHSRWLNEQALENYRKSDLFELTWGESKKLFKEKPTAWSLKSIEILT